MSKPICGYIKVGDFEGGSADAHHTGWSEIIGLNAAVERKTGSFIKSDNPVGSTSLGDVIVEKLVDAASVKLMKACATGQKIPKVQIQMCATVAGKLAVVLEYELNDAIVSKYELSGTNYSVVDAAENRPSDTVAFAFAKITWTFHKKDSTGASVGKVSESYTVGS